MLQRLLTTSDKLKKETSTVNERCEDVEEGQPHNPYNEILILQHHSDIVRLLLRISDRRFVSAGDDNNAVIWEVQYGRRVATLLGHTHPITSLLLLPGIESNDDALIISGSSDKHIKMWNADTGECVHTLTEHGASVRCLQLIDHGLFCAGGENLSLWSREGQFLDLIENPAIEDIHLMISIKNDRLVTAAGKELVVYRLNLEGSTPKLIKIKSMQSHFEAIHSLIPISTSCFGTGSVDGMIIIWTSSNLQQTKILSAVTEYKDENKRFPYSIQALICIQECVYDSSVQLTSENPSVKIIITMISGPLWNCVEISSNERYLFAAIGCGFYAFDITADKETLVLQKRSAHLSKITSMGFACEGELLATCAEDRCMRLWGRKPSSDPPKGNMAVTTMERFTGLQSNELLALNSPWEPSLLGECCAHGGPVQGFLDFDHEGIVTCGSDGLVIVWKNAEMQKVRRNQTVRKLLISCDGIV